MLRILKTMTVVLLTMTMLSCSTSSSADKTKVQGFYDLLSNPGSETHATAFKAATSENWESVGNYSGQNKTRGAFLGQVAGFGKLIPDLKWEVKSMHQDGNKVIVRSKATGTPKGPLFGVDGEGKSFEIMTIDVHELENGLITKTYHVEDWAGGLRQLSGPKGEQKSLVDKTKVQAFYDVLSNPTSQSHKTAFMNATSKSWESLGDYSGKNKTQEAFLGQVGYFGKLIPDLKWEVKSMHVDGNRVIVRSRATGTPNGPLFGVDGKGKGFEIMTIDIHEFENGLINRTFHVEDWAGALRQLAGPKK